MITAKITIAQPIRVNASGISNRGARGKSTYELYLETTTDNPPMTEAQFVDSKAVLEQTTGQSITHGMSQKSITDELALKVDKVTGKSLISDAEITRLAGVTNQTLAGLGGEPTANKKTTINPASEVEFPNSKGVAAALALKTDDATLQASMIAAVPVIPYRSRVLADSGVINDISALTKLYIEDLKLLPNTLFEWDSDAGMKTRTSGANTYATKLYDMSSNNKDAVQVAEANQPFVGGGIAPSEKLKIKNNISSTTKKMTLSPEVKILDGTDWSVTTVFKWYGSPDNNQELWGKTGATTLRVKTDGFYNFRFVGAADLPVAITYDTKQIIGKTAIITVINRNRKIEYWLNGYLVGSTTTINSEIAIDSIMQGRSTASLNGEIYRLRILNKSLSASEVQSQHAFLRLKYPEIDGVNIGNQHWATSNYEGVLTGDGTVIPEVQGNNTASNPELVTNSNYESGLAGELLNEIGGAVATYSLNTVSPISGTQDSRLVVTTVGSSAARPIIRPFSVNTGIIGKEYQIKFDYKLNSGNCTFVSLNSGASPVAVNQNITGTGTFVRTFICTGNTSDFGLIGFDGTKLFDLQVDNYSIKEVGWADLTTPAWCYYNNDPLNGAVYGKLYNWYAVKAIADNPPAGWRVPIVADILQLGNYLGGSSIAGGKMKKEGLLYFNAPNTGAANESGFSAIGGGMRNVDGTFIYNKVLATIATLDKYLANSYYGYCIIYNSTVLSSTSFHETPGEKSGQSIRLIRNEPVGANERTIETGYITNALGATNLDISIPFGYQVESVRIDSETNITGLSAKLLTGALTELETLFSAKSVTANVQKVIAADADQSIQQTDAVVRINGTKTLTTARFRVWIKITKVVFS